MVPAMARFETSSDAVLQSEIPDADGPVELVEESAPIPAAYAPEEPERVVQLRPAILQPLQSFDEIEADGDELGDEQEPDAGLERFLRMSPLLARKSDQIAEAFGVTNDGAPEPEVAEDCYPSLLDMAPVVQRREPLRIDDSMYDEEAAIEHAVVFPGQEAPWPVEAARAAAMPTTPIPALPAQTGVATSRPFERPSVVPVPGSPLASPGRAAPSIQASSAQEAGPATQPFAQSFGQSPVQPQAQAPAMPDAEEADRALRAALETLQRMTARG
jgi:predicted component of type VI protein secretion system